MANDNTKKVLGIGNYTAHRLPNSHLSCLRAIGILPCLNYEAQLERRPERITPPRWDLVFYVQDICQTATKHFNVSALFSDDGATEVTVFDAVGEHSVAIEDAPIIGSDDAVLSCSADRDEFKVYGRLPRPGSGHQGCIVVPADALVLAIYYPVFGPASKAECDAFVTENCAVAAPFAAGEVPWPLAERE